jgi:N-acetylglutamate synthase-like GNAT family acetyltransferase
MKIREFRASDAGEVSRLSNKNLWAFQHTVTVRFLSKLVSNPRFRMFVAEDESIIGFCGVNFEKPIAELGPICIRSDARLSGVGRALFQRVLLVLQSLGIEGLIIKVKASNIGAQGFFKSLGFAKIDEAKLGTEAVEIMRYGLE